MPIEILGKTKILNVLKASEKQVMDNEVIKTMIIALGTGISDEFNIDKLRYGKIVLMTDADR